MLSFPAPAGGRAQTWDDRSRRTENAAMTLDTSRAVMQTIGDYGLLDKVAEGGMGSIYKARHRQSGQLVAIKVMTAPMINNPVLLKRFEQEFRAASRLNHPNIIRALDYGEEAGVPYLVMEFVDGESLGQKLDRDGPMPESEAIRLIAQVAQGLHRAHKQKLVHRDVKPDNILITADGQAKLADLGLVKEMEADLNLTRTGRGLGTPHFMAPEQFRNAKSANARCDIYSLGATLYMMVTGELPFRSNGPLDAWLKKMGNEITPPRTLVPALSERVDWAIRRAMSGDPEQRPETCREFVEDLTGHSTRKINTADLNAAVADLWYLVYKDEEGTLHRVKGSTAAIRSSLRDGRLGDASNIRASRSKTGPFEPLRSYPEFRDLVVAPAPLNMPAVATTTPSGVGVAVTPAAGGAVADGPAPSGSHHSSRLVPPPPAGEEVVQDSGTSGSLDYVPHIELGPSTRKGAVLEWLKWLVLVAILGGGALLAYYLLPRGMFPFIK
jgi:serine/threonine protein kinase